MNRDQRQESTKTKASNDGAKVQQPNGSRGSELSDEQIASISGGIGFPENGGSNDTSIAPTPTGPTTDPMMP